MSDETTALSTQVSDEELLELQRMGGGVEQANAVFSSMRLEHTTNFEGNDNPLKGHFTITTRNELGEWLTDDLGTTLDVQFLMRRYRLYYKPKGGTSEYSTKEFDNLMDTIHLTKKTTTGEHQQFELFASGNARDLKDNPKFQTTKDDGSVKSELQLLSVLYCKVEDKIVRWRMNISATIAYSNYSKQVMPFGILTQAKAKEMLNGTVKYYCPVFVGSRALNKEEISIAIKDQKNLREVFSLSSPGSMSKKALDASGAELPALPTADGLETTPF